ncbi:MAG: GrpB family protein [Minisyncoccia bacterium]
MLKEGQKRYLESLSPERANGAVSIKPYDRRTAVVAQGVVNKIKQRFPEADTRFMGASALGIAGQNDIDIYVLCPPDCSNVYFMELSKIFGGRVRNKWRWLENGYEISVHVTDPREPKQKEQIEIFRIFKTKPEVLKEYETLKISMNGRSYRDYMAAKYEFYNKVLGIK